MKLLFVLNLFFLNLNIAFASESTFKRCFSHAINQNTINDSSLTYKNINTNNLYFRTSKNRKINNTLITTVDSKGNEIKLFGKLGLDTSLPGYHVFTLTDSKGLTHHFDNESIKKVKIKQILSPSKIQIKELNKNPPRKTISSLSPSKLRKNICPQFSKIRKEPIYKNLRNYMINNPKGKFQLALAGYYAAACGSSFYLGIEHLPQFYMLDGSRGENNIKGWFADHQSNFSIGMFMMSSTYNCLSALTPSLSGMWLKNTLAIDAVMNLHFEVYMGVDRSPISDDKIRTDIGDLSTGFMAVATMAFLVNKFEKIYPIDFLKVCK